MPSTQSEIEALLQRAGIAPTAQRLAICRYVFNEADHPTAEDVKGWMDANFPKVSLATVYNTLNLLVEKGVLQEFRLPSLERTVYDCNTSRHSHFVDMDTGEIIDLDDSKLELIPHLDDSYDVQRAHAVLIGRRRKPS
jgi:Fur family iron response transcriptional regulator